MTDKYYVGEFGMYKGLLLIASFFIFGNSWADPVEFLSPVEHFAKCYSKLTDQPVDFNSTLYKDVQSKKISATQACMSVFNKAMFDKSQRKLTNANDPVARSILNNFHRFHLSWLTMPLSASSQQGTFSLLDNDEPALYLTDALFMNRPYKYIVTAKETLQGVRTTNNPGTYVVGNTNLEGKIVFLGPMKPAAEEPDIRKNYIELPGPRIQVGVLTGVRTAPPRVYPLSTTYSSTTPLTTPSQLQSRRLEATSYDMSHHPGGGILGSSTSLINNSESYSLPDGGLHVHRRFSNNFFYDFMCAKLPSLRDSDGPVQTELQQFKTSTLSFRTSATCLGCHTTIDNFAHALRNITVSTGNSFDLQRQLNDAGVPVVNVALVHHHAAIQNAVSPVPDSDRQYFRKQPNGRLTYRDYNGKLINLAVNGVEDLGNKIANQDDIYACAAKRYYYFLTGVNIPLDPIPIDPKTKKPVDKKDNFAFYHREKIVALARKLKTGVDSSGNPWNLRSMINEIIASDTFRARNAAVVGDDL